MAGDWIKVENVTPDKPEVHIIAEHCQIHPDHALGALIRLWIRADEQTVDGNAAGVTKSWINHCAGVANFADGMERAGWLLVDLAGLHFPNFDRHSGNPAKQRALTMKRGDRYRKRKRNADSVTQALPEIEIETETDKPPVVPLSGTLSTKPQSNGHLSKTCIAAFMDAYQEGRGTAADRPDGRVVGRLSKWLKENQVGPDMWRDRVRLAAGLIVGIPPPWPFTQSGELTIENVMKHWPKLGDAKNGQPHGNASYPSIPAPPEKYAGRSEPL